MSNRVHLIDVHQHARPASFYEAVAAAGMSTYGGRPFPPLWERVKTSDMMDRLGLAAAVLSAPEAEGLFQDEAFARAQSRSINEFYAEVIDADPGRFAAFACLPMPHVSASLREIEYALDELKLDGVCLLSSYLQLYLGHPDLDEIMAELNRRGAVVFIHPSTPVGMHDFRLDIPSFVLEFPFDTTRALVNIFGRDLQTRFAGIRMIFAHAGGAAPFLAPRIALLDLFANRNNALSVDEARAKVVSFMRGVYFDTALTVSDDVILMLMNMVGPSRIVFGIDYPQATEAFAAECARTVRESKHLDADAVHDIGHRNIGTLMPRLAGRIPAGGNPLRSIDGRPRHLGSV